MVEDRLQKLIDLEDIRTLKYRYMAGMDVEDYDSLAGCFTEDATLTFKANGLDYRGKNAIMEFMTSSLPTYSSSKIATQPEITFVDEDHAAGRWNLDYLSFHPDTSTIVRGACMYSDQYERIGDEWRIRSMTITRIFEYVSSFSEGAKFVGR